MRFNAEKTIISDEIRSKEEEKRISTSVIER